MQFIFFINNKASYLALIKLIASQFFKTNNFEQKKKIVHVHPLIDFFAKKFIHNADRDCELDCDKLRKKFDHILRTS